MAEYIEREAVMQELGKFFSTVNTVEQALMLNRALKVINWFPAADVAPVVHGRWKYYHKQNIAVCTNCSFERDLDANFGKAISCPNCGAKMDAEAKT